MGCSGTNEKQINIHENNEIYINNNFGFIPTQRYNFNSIQNNSTNKKNCYICGENLGKRYYIENSNGIECCKCMFYSNFAKKFKCEKCNSQFCFKCGQEYYPIKKHNCYICGENFGKRYYIENSNGIECCKCMFYSNFSKKFKCNNCNSQFCFKCGKN